MKKIYIFLFLLILASISGSLTAQTTVTIGEGTQTYYRLPLNMYYRYSLTQEIYTADEIGVPAGGSITSISFHYAYNSSFNLGNIQVFLMNTSKSSFNSNTDMVPISFDNMVYDGNMSATGNGWITLTLDRPFAYDGRNLLVCMLDTIGGNYPGTSYTFYTTTTTGTRAISWYSDNQQPNLNNLSAWSGNKDSYTYRANLRFDITPNSQEVAIGTSYDGDWAITPYHGNYSYSFVEQLYTAEEIGIPTGGTIHTVSFNMKPGSPQTNHITLYLKQVSRSTFSSGTDFEPVSTSDVVYEGDWSIAEGWNTITLDVPFEYDGTSNLMVAMHENTPGDSYRYFHTTDKPNSVILQGSDDTDPDPYNLSAWTGNTGVYSGRSNIKIGYVPNSVVDNSAIGEGTNTFYNLPVNMYFHYSLTQQIYKAEEINVFNGGTIDSLSFHYASTNSFDMNNVKLYLQNTTKSKFTSNTDMVPVTESDRVWQGTLSATGAGWITIHFDTPFNYTGGNLLVCFLDTTTGYPGNTYKFYTTPTTDTLAISWYSDNTRPTLGSTSYSGSRNIHLFRNNIRIGITPNPCSEPSNLQAWAHPSSASLSWSSGDNDHYNVRCRPAQVYLSENFEGGTMPNGWTSLSENGTGSWHVSTGDDEGIETGAAAGHYNAIITHTSSGNTTYLISPVLDLSGAATATLNFSYINKDWSGDVDSLDVYYRINGGAWQLLFHTAENHESWTNESLTLPNLANNYQIAFKMTDGYGWGVGIDEVQIYEISSGTWTVYNGLGNSYFNLTGLTNNTTYIWQVQGGCGSVNSMWSPFGSFTTNCDMVQTPYEEGFETEENFSCWTPIAGTRRYKGTSYSGSYSLLFKGTTNNLILLPDIDNAIQEVKISFYLRPESYTNAACGTFEFGYVTDPTNINSFVTVNSYHYSDWPSNGYVQRTEYLTELPDGAILAFRHHPTDSTSGWYVDKVVIGEDDVCKIPYHLTATDISATSATLNWEARGDETAWNLYYGKASESSYTFVSNITKPYSLTGLEPGTRYKYYVRALCTGYSASSSASSELHYFSTECDVTVPYTETFESGDALTCWTRVSGTQERSSGNNHDGSYKLLFSGSLSNIIALPELDQPINNLQLTFWTRPESCTNSNCGTFDVGYMTDPTDASTFVSVNTYSFNDWTSNDYLEKTEYFPDVPSGARIAFRHNANSTSWFWYVDDVEVTNPGCMAPHQLRATNISNTSVTLDWTPRAGDSYWKIYYKKTTESSYSSTIVASHPHMLDGLTTGATYEFKVQTLCTTNSSSITDPITVTTGCGSNPIPYAYDFETVPPMECYSALSGSFDRRLNSSYNHTPGGVGYMNFYGNLTRVVTLPEFDQPISNLQLSFWTRPESYANAVCGTFDVGYLTNPTDTSTFVVVNTYRYNDWTSNTNVNKVEYFPNAPAGSRIAFRHNALSTYWYWFVDDVEVTEAPACIAPYHLAATTSSTSASLDWTPRGNETSWTIYYKKTGASSYSSQSTTYHPRTIYNLEEGAQYQFYVKASCGNYVYSAPSDTVTFTPTCAQTIPYAYDFENSVPFMCWNVLTSFSDRSSGSYNHTSGGNYYIYFGHAYRNIIAMPQFDQPINNLQVTFWTRPESNNSNCGTFDVGYLTNPTDTSTFVAVSTYSYNDWSSSSYQEKTEYFAQAPAGARIAFRHNANSTSWYWFVDDIVVTEAPACIAPYRLTANVNGTTAILDWTARDTESSWNLYYRKVGDASFTTLNQITKPYTLNGLDERTSYEYYVVAYCGSSSTSIPSDTCTFTTTCAPQYLPYTYGFETQDPFACWYPVKGTVAISSSYHHTGVNGLQFSGSNPRIIAMPTLEQPISNLQLSFWTRPEASPSGTFDVGYMTDLSDPSSFVVVNTYTYDNWSSSNTYRKKTEYFDGAPANALIAFRNNSSSTGWDWFVDDVEVSYYSCKTPHQLTLNSSTPNSITVDWTARANETAWKLYYRKTSNSFYTTVNVTSKPYTLTGLEPNTAYECYVKADCGGGLLSNPSDFLSFITECDEQTIPYQYAFEEDVPYRCWHAFNGNARRSSASSSSGYENHTAGGNYSMVIEYGDVVRLPQFDQPISDLQISLWIYPEYYSSSYVDTFSIGYLTNPDNAESFVEIASYVSTDWENREFKLKMAHFIGAPGNAVMALRSKGHGNKWYVDDVEVTTSSACPRPQHLTATGVTAYTATLGWTSYGGTSTWNLYYKRLSDVGYTEVANITHNPYILAGLDASTEYTFYVQAVCGSDSQSEPSETGTFITDCMTPSLPYTYDFMDPGPYNCWTALASSGSAYRYNSYDHSPEGNGYCLYFYNAVMALPDFNQSISNLQLSFWAKTHSSNNILEVGYLTNLSDPTTFVPVASYNSNDWNSNNYPFYHITEYLDGAPANAYIAIRSSNGWYIDDVEVTVSPGCKPPYQLTATDITSNSAILNWTARGSETSWNLYYKKSTENSYTTISNIHTKPYTLTGLEDNVNYIFYVTAVCGSASISTPSATKSFTTLCGVKSIPYVYNFEDTAPFGCWIPVSGNVTRLSNSSYNHTPGGQYRLDFRGSYSNTIALPSFDQPLSNLRLTFWTRPESYSASYCGTFDVGYMTDPADASTFVVVNTYSYDDWTSNTYLEKTIQFTGAPANAHIAFRHNANSSSWYWYVDDVEVTAGLECASPTDLAATTVTSNSATLNWTAGGSETTWNLYYQKTGETSFTTLNNITKPYTLTGLEANSSYEVYVTARCGSDNSYPSEHLTFTTPCATFSIPYSYDFETPEPLSCWNSVWGSGYDITYFSNIPDNHFLRVFNGIVTLPQFNQAIQNLQLKFQIRPYYYTNSSSGTFDVGYLTNPTDVSTFVVVSTYDYSEWTSASFMQKVEYFTDAPAGACMALRNNITNNSYYWFIDDVSVTVAPSCKAPNQLVATNITTNSAQLNWNVRGSESQWVLYYRKVGATSYSAKAISSKPYTLTGLESGTLYECYVRAVCSSTSSNDNELYYFSTECETYPLPYAENFNVSPTTKMKCWTEVAGYVNYSWANDSPENLYLYFTNTSPRVLALPAFSQPISNLQLSFKTRPESYNNSNCGTFDVGYVTDLTDASSFVAVNTYNYDDWNSNTFLEKIEYFTGAPAGAYIAFRHNANSPVWYWYVDDVEVKVASGCKAPYHLAATNVTDGSATLNWTPRGSETAWKLYYKKSTDSLYTVVNNVPKPYMLTGLETSTLYQFYVTAACGGNTTSDPSETAFFATVCPDQMPIPYYYDFETAEPLNCWNFISVSNYGRATSSYLSSESSTFLDVYGSEGTVTLPKFNQPIRNLQLSFRLSPRYNSSASGDFEIGYVTSLAVDTATFVPMAIYDPEEWSSTTLIQKIVYFDGAPDGSYIAFRVNSNSSYDWLLDDVEVTMVPSCLTVQPSVSNVTSTSATISWTPQGSHASWNIYYKSSVESEYNVVSNVTSNPYILTGLYSGAAYECYVEGICDDGTYGDSSPSIYFVTECGTNTAVPYYYDFEDVSPFYCWIPLAGQTSINSYSSYNHTEGGSYSLEFNNVNSYIAMPKFNAATNTLQVSFWLQRPYRYGNGFEGNGTFSVGYLTNLADINSFVPVATYNYDEWDSTEYKQKVVQMTDAPAQSYIVFRKQGMTPTGSYVVWFLDDVEVTLIPVCDAPVDLDVDNISTESATLYWTSENGPWDIMLNETLIENVPGSPYTFTNLTSNTTYQVKVRSFCEGVGESEWSEVITFTTEAHIIPSYITFSGNTAVCPGESTTITAGSNVPGTYVWNTGTTGPQVTLSAGTYTVTITTSTGDQLSSSITIFQYPTYALSETRSVCPSSLPYTWNGKTFTAAGTQTATLQTVHGCDSVVTMTLTLKPTYNVTDAVTVCESELPYTWYDLVFSEAGTQTTTLESMDGCDSVVMMTLTVNPTYNVSETRSVCPGALPYTWNGKTFTGASTQTATLQTVNGCDSVVTMTLTINNAFNITEERSVCLSEMPYVWNGKTFTNAGTQTVTLQSVAGCDSIVTMILTVNPTYNVTDAMAVCQSELPYTWNGKTFTNAGTQTATLQTVNGCDSVVTMTLTVNPTYHVTDAMTVCENELPYTWYDLVFAEAGTQTTTLESMDGCDSVVTMTLTLYPSYEVTESRTVCPSALPYTWNGKTFTAAGTQTATLQTIHGCDSVVTMTLTVNDAFNITEERAVCLNEMPYTWNGKTFTNAGTQTATLQSVAGCDSIVTMILTVNPTYNVTDAMAVCQSELPYTWNGKTFTNAGTQTATLQTVNGCDSVVTMTLTVNPTYHVTDAMTVCENELPYTWYDLVFSEAGTQTTTLESMDGCDSVVTMTLTLYPSYEVTDSRTVCPSALPYTWNGKTFTAAGTQTATLQTIHGCDSVVTMTLTVNDAFNVTENRTVCQSELPYTWNGKTFTAAGTQTATLQSVAGCDSIVTMTLAVNPTYNVTENRTVCQSELPYTWNGKTFTAAGTQTATLQAVNGCDSVVTMTLTVNPTYNVTDAMTVCENELPYTWYDLVFSEAGTQTTTLETVDGCDSVVTMTLTLYPTYEVTESRTICQGELPYVWNGKTFTAAGTQTATLQTIHGCDSVVTMTLTINNAFNVTENRTVCQSELPYTWNGKTFTAAGTQTATLQSVAGCDSIVTMTLAVNPSYNVTESQTICQSELPYVWNGQTFTAAGTQTVTLQAVNGCDSVVTMTLTVNPTYSVTVSQAICQSELPYVWNNKIFTGSGTKVATLQTVNGCDSVVTMVLTVNQAYTVNDYQTICQNELPYTWNDVTFISAGTLIANLETVNGCDSVVTMTLTVNPNYNVTDNRTICQNELPYTWNGRTFTAAGTQTAALSAVNGCDSVVTMILTVNPSYQVTASQTICQSELPYTWNGQTFTAAGTQTATLETVNGCDSVVTMTLTVNPTYQVTASQTICQSELPYTWNGQTFTAAGTQTATLQTVNGCDSVVTMTLTVNPTYQVTASQTICQSELPYTWNGQTFTAAGTQTATLQTVNGCDSVVTMTLTVNPTPVTTLYDTICEGEHYAQYGFDTIPGSYGTYQLQRVLPSALGCDSTVTLMLTVGRSYLITEEATTCDNEPYEWHGHTYAVAGVYYDSLQTVNGCDSICVLTLTTTPSYEIHVSDTATRMHEYVGYGLTLMPVDTGVFEYEVQNYTINGCDSVIYLTLFVQNNTGIVDYDESIPEFTLFPNPAITYVNITGDLMEQVYVYNALGQLMMVVDAESDTHVHLELHDYPVGQYVVNIKLTDGRTVQKKMIIRR